MDLKNVRDVWLDVESTGLHPHLGERLLQVACIVTDGNYDQVGEPYTAVISFDAHTVAQMREQANDFVRDMHDATNLWDRLVSEGLPVDEVDTQLSQHLKSLGVTASESRLGGNSITLDRNFLLFEMPHTYSSIGYRNIDMTSVSEFIHRRFPNLPWFEKKKSHDALDDIRESIAEAKYYKQFLDSLT